MHLQILLGVLPLQVYLNQILEELGHVLEEETRLEDQNDLILAAADDISSNGNIS